MGGEHDDDRRLRPRLREGHRARAIRLDALDRLAARLRPDAEVLAAVVQVQRVRAALAAVTDHRNGLAEVRRTVGVVVDLHAVLLITTGPERTTSTIPCRVSSSTNSPTSSAPPENSTVVPSGPLDRTFPPRCKRASTPAAATVATTSSRLGRSSATRTSTSGPSTSRPTSSPTWSAS